MGEGHTKNQLLSLATTAIVVTLIISAIWAWIWNDTKQQNHLISRSYLDRIEALEQQLHQRSLHEQDLLDRYSKASDLKTALENNLTATTTKLEYLQEKLEYLQENLNDYQLGNWESKYLVEKSGNDLIFETMAQLEEEIEHLKEMQEVLILDHQETLEAERNEYLEHIATLKTELATSTKKNKKLKKQLIPVVKQEKSVVTANLADYRAARLISLMNNIKGLSSKDKLNILVKVIPTVPEGIATHELTNLISGMNSGDILSLIKSSSRHFHKSKNKKSISLLLSKMEKADAEAASKLLLE